MNVKTKKLLFLPPLITKLNGSISRPALLNYVAVQDLNGIEDALGYIDGYWPQLLRENKQDEGSLIGMPNPYMVPSADDNGHFEFAEQYYWDTYFTALGMTDPKYESLVTGMLDNLVYLFKRFGSIPNANRMYFTSRSHPPLLTSIIFLVYENYHKSDEWLAEYIEVAKQEYHQVWLSTKHPYWHNVHHGLSRYYDINVLHDLAEAESGWDMTPRFQRKCLDYLPIDLNALLYKYECDFARAAEIAGDPGQKSYWLDQAARRQASVSDLMWGKVRGFFFDYNYQKQELGSIWSLAAYFTLWSGMATTEQAAALVKNLKRFEKPGGLTTTTKPLIDMTMFGSLKTQWAYPNGWAPLHLIVAEGLNRYGYKAEATKVAKTWLTTCLSWYQKNHQFIEKYNVVNLGKEPLGGVYPTQNGFGWTNGVFVYLTNRLADYQMTSS